jgi:hypothetical protein
MTAPLPPAQIDAAGLAKHHGQAIADAVAAVAAAERAMADAERELNTMPYLPPDIPRDSDAALDVAQRLLDRLGTIRPQSTAGREFIEFGKRQLAAEIERLVWAGFHSIYRPVFRGTDFIDLVTPAYGPDVPLGYLAALTGQLEQLPAGQRLLQHVRDQVEWLPKNGDSEYVLFPAGSVPQRVRVQPGVYDFEGQRVLITGAEICELTAVAAERQVRRLANEERERTREEAAGQPAAGDTTAAGGSLKHQLISALDDRQTAAAVRERLLAVARQ